MKILERIGDATLDFADLTAAVLDAGYGASGRKIERAFIQRRERRFKRREKRMAESRQRQRFYSMLSRLRKDGLIQETTHDRKYFIALTGEGRRRLEVLRKRQSNALPTGIYNIIPDTKGSKFTITVFDIPERERKKRAWLRSTLRNLGFRCLQKSVWVGKVIIPKAFLDDLRDLELVEYLEIFEVSKAGSLRQLV